MRVLNEGGVHQLLLLSLIQDDTRLQADTRSSRSSRHGAAAAAASAGSARGGGR